MQTQLHPIVKQMAPSPDQETPVLLRGKDVAVSAGAGTGKTRTLVARFLSLLAEQVPLRSIVAITFTKKAALEMRNRVRKEIRDYLSGSEVQDRQFWLNLYESLDAARISTIHSLAAEILRQHPAEARLDPRFELLEDAQSARLESQAVQAALSWAGEDPEAAYLFSSLGTMKLTRAIGELLGKRLDVEDALARLPDDPWELWSVKLIEPIRVFVEDPQVQDGLNELLSLEDRGILARAEAAGDSLTDDLKIVNQNWRRIRESLDRNNWEEVSRSLGTLADHLKQKGRAANWEPANPKAIIKDLQNSYQQALGATRNLDLGTDRLMASRILPQLIRVFRYAVRVYAESRQQQNVLDFDDLEQRSLELFREHPEVVSYWRDQVDHLLVDEYQDTNSRQRSLVNMLSGESGKLFIVGDGKQSIYRFRGADVSVFRSEQERIGSSGLACRLSRSYRAHDRLLDQLNSILAPVLGQETEIPYLEPFAPLDPGRERPPAIENGPYLELHLAAGKKGDGAGLLAAEAVAASLKKLVDEPGGGNAQGEISYGDIAVLCRASSSFSDFESAFEKAGIPYLTVSGQGFYERPEIRDLLNSLSFFSDPQNDLVAAGLLRSPVIGLSDDQLLKVRKFQLAEKHPNLYRAARSYAGSRSGALANQLASFLELVDGFVELAGRITVGELLADYIDRTGYLAALISAGQQRGAQNIKKLVREAHSSGIVEIRDFLELVTSLRSVAVREGEAPSVLEGSVQIMTVHQAKGLEFPVVVLGDASKRDPSSRNILLDDQFGIVLPFSRKELGEDTSGSPQVVETSSFAYEIALEKERLKEAAESDRLLYVAATRAKELLILSGAIGKPNRDNQLPALGGWLGRLADPLGLHEIDLDLDQEGDAIHHQNLEKDGVRADLWVYESSVMFDDSSGQSHSTASAESSYFPRGFTPLEPAGLARPSARLEPSKLIKEPYDSGSDHMPSIVVGKVVHLALESWRFPSTGEDDFLDWTAAAFQSAGFHQEAAVKDGYRKVRKMLERFLASDLYRQIESAQVVEHEVSFSYWSDAGSLEQGTIDALYHDGSSWKLVEFKTDQIRSAEGLQQIWEETDYQEQVAGYLAAAERLLGERPEPVLCFLNYQGGIHLETSRWQARETPGLSV